jgi:hypothetical protein
MSAVAGAVGAGLALLALKAAVGSQGSKELTGGFKIVDGAIRVIVDPTVPLIPDRRKAKVDNPVGMPKATKTPKSSKP